MSENLRDAIGVILEAGFQIESDAFKTLVQFGRAETLRPLIDEVLKVAGSVEPRPLFISSDLVLKAVEKLELIGNRQPEAGTSLGAERRFAQEYEARLEVVFDPTGKLGTTGVFDDFLHYFRSRFEKMSALFRQRIDTRSGGTIADALASGANGRGRFVCMVVDKRERDNRILLTVDDYDEEAVVLVTDANPSLWQTARRLSREQVLFLETRKSSGKLLVAENISCRRFLIIVRAGHRRRSTLFYYQMSMWEVKSSWKTSSSESWAGYGAKWVIIASARSRTGSSM